MNETLDVTEIERLKAKLAQLLEANIKKLEAEVETEKGAMRSAIEGMRAYVKGEREACFCTSDAIQDLLDQLFMQCLDHAPEYANFIKAAEEQHAATQGAIAELRSALEKRATEVAQLQTWIAAHKVDLLRIAAFRERAEKAEAKLKSIGELVVDHGCSTDWCGSQGDLCLVCLVSKVLEES